MTDGLNEYETATRRGYQDVRRAEAYDRQHMQSLSWARLTMAREVAMVRRWLRRFGVGASGNVLDVPCGTGVAAPAFDDGTAVVAMDISREMMAFARSRYSPQSGFVQGDITALPFADSRFDATVVLGFMHRVPVEVKEAAARELGRVTARVLIVSFSVDNFTQRLKQRIIRLVKPSHAFASAPLSLLSIERLLARHGFRVAASAAVVPGLSADYIVVAERVARPRDT